MKAGVQHKKALEASGRALLLVRQKGSNEYHILEAHGEGAVGRSSERAGLLCWMSGRGPWVPGYDGGARTLCGVCWETFQSPVPTYGSLAEFYRADERRLLSGEVGYGSSWRDCCRGSRWRVAHVRRTGEIYACRLPPYRDAGRDTVRVLAKLPADKAAEGTGPEARQTLEKVLDGWLVRMELPGGLRWVRQRLLPMTKDAAL